jgi:AraC-like DNA-binding protein
LAKLAVAVEQALARRAATGGSAHPDARVLARGDGWVVADVVCAAGPRDRPFEEQHAEFSISIVAAGTFQYRSGAGCELMTPGSLLLGNAGERFECGHDHGCGDRCIAFWYAPEYFERLAADAGARRLEFGLVRLPPLRALSPVVGRACAGITGSAPVSWEEIGVHLATRTIELVANREGDAGANNATRRPTRTPPNATARVARVVRAIDREPEARHDLADLCAAAALSPFHFLRTFERVTGVTPHQYVLRTRLREAARRLANGRDRVLDVALDCGFGDVSNFTRTFRAEFGMSPRQFRRTPPSFERQRASRTPTRSMCQGLDAGGVDMEL